MEEILASIRRIIADDQEVAKDTAPPRAAPPPPDESEEEDVLDLADAAASAVKVEAPEVSFRKVDEGQIDFDAITDEEEEEQEEPPRVAHARAPAARLAPEPEPEPEPFFARLPDPPPAPQPEDRLLSHATDAAVGQAFNLLAHTVLTNNARTLEDLVRDMLRPMLKNWLDDNLPSMVERLVRAEIERVARGSRR